METTTKDERTKIMAKQLQLPFDQFAVIFNKLDASLPHKVKSYNICTDCKEEVKPDEWSDTNFTLCIDCGADELRDYREDYAQRKAY
tara:strand:- start:432 stop:692 length:261 start_codon:yes stop_codon:yes gene_type:complete